MLLKSTRFALPLPVLVADWLPKHGDTWERTRREESEQQHSGQADSCQGEASEASLRGRHVNNSPALPLAPPPPPAAKRQQRNRGAHRASACGKLTFPLQPDCKFLTGRWNELYMSVLHTGTTDFLLHTCLPQTIFLWDKIWRRLEISKESIKNYYYFF